MATTTLDFERRRACIHRPFAVMVKVNGALCNLDCDYCYYIEKEALYPEKARMSFRMTEDVLEKLIRDTIEAQPMKRVEFVWHGGEPTLLGVDYFKQIVEWERMYAGEHEVFNYFQTNATLIDDRWGEFLAENNFLCGVSVDGPERLHNSHRKYGSGKGSWKDTMRGISVLRRYGVDFNVMVTVNAENVLQPIAVYDFLKTLGTRYFQFSPVVEQITTSEDSPYSIVSEGDDALSMTENVTGELWGNFLCKIFDQWSKRDVGEYFVNIFENTLTALSGQEASLCFMRQYCSCSPAIEHNGDVYACDHFVFPKYRTGNMMNMPIEELVKGNEQLFFEERKFETLSERCKSCQWLKLCWGDCPKNRLNKDASNMQISTLCEGWQQYFAHTEEFFVNYLKSISKYKCKN